MALLEFSPEYSVEIKEMDDQHKRLFELINQLHEAMSQGKSKEVMGDILNGLLDYTRVHFTKEEEYMKKFNYSGLANQQMSHQKFISKIEDYKRQFEEGNMALSLEVTSFLKDWLINHIKGTDKQYSQCFKDNGLS